MGEILRVAILDAELFQEAIDEIRDLGDEGILRFTPDGLTLAVEDHRGNLIAGIRILAGDFHEFTCTESSRTTIDLERLRRKIRSVQDGDLALLIRIDASNEDSWSSTSDEGDADEEIEENSTSEDGTNGDDDDDDHDDHDHDHDQAAGEFRNEEDEFDWSLPANSSESDGSFFKEKVREPTPVSSSGGESSDLQPPVKKLRVAEYVSQVGGDGSPSVEAENELDGNPAEVSSDKSESVSKDKERESTPVVGSSPSESNQADVHASLSEDSITAGNPDRSPSGTPENDKERESSPVVGSSSRESTQADDVQASLSEDSISIPAENPDRSPSRTPPEEDSTAATIRFSFFDPHNEEEMEEDGVGIAIARYHVHLYSAHNLGSLADTEYESSVEFFGLMAIAHLAATLSDVGTVPGPDDRTEITIDENGTSLMATRFWWFPNATEDIHSRVNNPPATHRGDYNTLRLSAHIDTANRTIQPLWIYVENGRPTLVAFPDLSLYFASIV